MRLLTALLLAAAVAGPAAAGPAAQTAITPGYWESTNKMLSPIRSTSVEKRCITPAEVEKFMAGPSNRHYTCTYPTREVANGKIRLAGSCKTKNSAPVPITGEGVFTRDTLKLDARVRAKLGGLSVPIHARTEGKRIGDTCPDPAPPAK